MKIKKGFLIVIMSFVAMLIGGSAGTVNAQSKSSSKSVVIYLTRHGETTANVMHRAQGWSDYTLTNKGVKGAEYLGRGLKAKGIHFKSAYSGDLTRQEKTAKGALKFSKNNKIKLKIDQRLREDNYGSYEGLPDVGQAIPDIAHYYGYKDGDEFLKKTGKNAMSKMQDGYYALDKKNHLKTNLPTKYRAETAKAVEKRMTKALTKIAKKQAKHGKGNVLVVSSGMSISLFLSTLNSPKYNAGPMENDAVTKLVYKNGKFTISGKVGSLQYFDAGKKSLEK